MLAINNLRKYSRYQAATGHLVLSLLVLGVLGYLVYFYWYPQPLFSIDAGWQGLRILAFVDIILGPCITLVIFNPKKKELFKDVAIIALIQISALSYGVYHVYQSRPALVVYADQTFYTVAYSEIDNFNLSDKLKNSIPLNRPIYKVFNLPRENTSIEYAVETDDFSIQNQIRDLRIESLNKQTPFYLLEKYLMDFKDNIPIINKYSLNLKAIQADLNNEDKQKVNAWLSIDNHNEFSYSTLIGRYGAVIVKTNKSTGSIEDYLNISHNASYM